MELVQKLMKKTSKYVFYSPLTVKVLTENSIEYAHYTYIIDPLLQA